MRTEKLDPTGSDRQLDADLFSDLGRPCSGAVDDDVRMEDPVGRPHRVDRVRFYVEPQHLDTALDPGTYGLGCHRDSASARCWSRYPSVAQ